MLSDAALIEADIRKAIKAKVPDKPKEKSTDTNKGAGITPKIPNVTKASYGVQDINEEDWGSNEDDVVLSSDDERTKSKKEAYETGKTNENVDDEEKHVEEEYVHDDVEKQDGMNVEMKDAEIFVESKVDEEMVDAAQANAEKIDKEKGDTNQAINDQTVKDAQLKDDDQATTTIPVT
ncbi:hypothetical protein Tco_0950136 [Tanacetum coccineum]